MVSVSSRSSDSIPNEGGMLHSARTSSPSLVKTICYPHTTKFSTHATRWGCDHEARALQRYCEVSQTTHTNFKCKDSGFTINMNMPYMGASPDSVVSCNCCGIGVVEVKCPFCLRKSVLSDMADSLVVIGGKLQLSKKHAHYYQVQTQMFVCDMMYADYVVWTECDVHIERIERDEQLWKHVEPRAKAFFMQAILPEVVGKLFSQPQPSKVHELVTWRPTKNIDYRDGDVVMKCRFPLLFKLTASTIVPQ